MGIEPSTSLSQPLLPPRDSDVDCASPPFSIQSLDPDLEELSCYSVDSINKDSILRNPEGKKLKMNKYARIKSVVSSVVLMKAWFVSQGFKRIMKVIKENAVIEML